ncbi:hypothetical protein [Candidatus Oleimmundimicrobium sp.]|uniref:hypothetical protein n=1 Tax=Candidatus Oleimmundimicrobium sp. TaxID=3060597 RepID=UPI00271EDA8D|nr:hypothetical protein [Candidatus Oleimmundimicrobium sp.]MDO8886167.1 hypothetical protein [Candidatus Oleimmundimicrobium sp.]
MMKYQISNAPAFLYSIGVRQYESGTLTKNKVKLFEYYKADSFTTEQKAEILLWCKDARFFNSRAQYAPELKSVMVAFPKAGFYRKGFN